MAEEVTQELRESLSVTIKRGIAVFALLIASSIVPYLPGTSFRLFGRLPLVILLRLGVGAAIVVILLTLHAPLTYLVRYYIRAIFWKKRGVAEFELAVTTITTDVVSLAYVCILYWAVVPSLGLVLRIILRANWPVTALQLGVILIVVIFVVRLCKRAAPLVTKAGDALAGRATEATIAVTTVVCPKCQAQHEKGSRFCKSCGAQIPETIRGPEKAPRIELKCPGCGSALEQGAKFCSSCGQGLSESKT